jgi:hypothetical protein
VEESINVQQKEKNDKAILEEEKQEMSDNSDYSLSSKGTDIKGYPLTQE